MNGFELRTMRKKKKILQVSRDLFRETGIEDISMDSIAEEADVSKVTIYKYFQSKEVLVREAMKDLFQEILEEYDRILSSHQSFAEKLTQYIRQRRSDISRKYYRIAEEACRLYPDLSAMVKENQDKALDLLMQLFAQGKAEGAVRPDVSDDLIGLHFRVLMSFLRQNPQEVEALYKDPGYYSSYLSLYWSPVILQPL